jgi:lysophospholipase L1-like esterase
MRNQGSGTIAITQVPAGATVQSATLLWDVLADQAGPSLATGTIDGAPVNGAPWASGPSPCWPVSSNFSYEADVTSQVPGNGAYHLAGFATGRSDGADPWSTGSSAPLLEGATLIVVYELASMPSTVIQIAAGAPETQSGAELDTSFSGFVASGPSSATTTFIVADGQESGNTAAANGSALPVGFPGADPQSAPSFSQGNLWDTVTVDISADVSPGDSGVSLAVTGNADCLVWVGQVLSVAAEGQVLSFGDSVAAGYGLGASEGHPDNPSAYPAVFAQLRGVNSENYAVEGACASNTEPACKHDSVNAQIGQVPIVVTAGTVTLTVGANDIDFGGCLKDIFTQSDYQLKSPSDPCSSRQLQANLDRFQRSLTADLKTISQRWPTAKIMIMDYYNPFPAPPAANGSPCQINQVLAFLYERQFIHESWSTIAKNFVLHHNKFTGDARQVQTLVYNGAASVLGHLNSVINTAAQGVATVIPVDFSGHDICASGSEWAFSPTAQAELQVRVGTIHKTIHLGAGGDDVCPQPASSQDWNYKLDKSFSDTGVHGRLTMSVGVNCLPHPTTAGQVAIASDFDQHT